MTVEIIPAMAFNLFKPLREKLTAERADESSTSIEVRDIIYACGVGAVVLDHLRGVFRGILSRGSEKTRLSFFQKEFLEVVELALNDVYPKVQRIAANATIPAQEKNSNLETLADYIARANSIRNELRSLDSWLERPMPTIDTSTFGGLGDNTSYEASDEIEARLRAGGAI